MGISKLTFCADLIHKDASPLILTVILSQTNLKDVGFSMVQVAIYGTPPYAHLCVEAFQNDIVKVLL